MPKLLVLALAGLLALLPLTSLLASNNSYPLTTAEAQAITTSLGCDADTAVIQSDQTNGMFIGKGTYAYGPFLISIPRNMIRVLDGPAVDHEASRMILLHEIGHCIDFQDGGINGPNPWNEFYADEFAIEHAPRFGLNPMALYWDLYDWASRGNLGRKGAAHGTAAERLLHFKQQLERRGYFVQSI